MGVSTAPDACIACRRHIVDANKPREQARCLQIRKQAVNTLTAREMDLRGLSVIKLARILDVSDAAIYYYFRSRAALVRVVVDQSSIGFEIPVINEEWWHGMHTYALRIYDALIANPGATQSMIGGGVAEPAQMRIFDAVINALVDGGQDRNYAAKIYSTYFHAALYAAYAHDERAAVGAQGLTANERTALAIDAGADAGVELSQFIGDPEMFDTRKQLTFLLDVITAGVATR